MKITRKFKNYKKFPKFEEISKFPKYHFFNSNLVILDFTFQQDILHTFAFFQFYPPKLIGAKKQTFGARKHFNFSRIQFSIII